MLSPTRVAAVVVALVATATMATSAHAAPVAPAQAPPGTYAGSAAAELVAVEASLAGQPIVDVALPDVDATVDSGADPRSTARAANLSADLLGQLDIGQILSQVEQSAPPDNAEPAVDTLLGVPENPLLSLDVSKGSAWARWPGDGVCVAPGSPISEAYAETANLSVLEIPELGNLVTVENPAGGVTRTTSSLATVPVDGQAGRALQATSLSQVTSVILFEGTPAEIRVEVAATPVLTATATGTPGGATADFNAPLVNIVTADPAIPDIPLVNLEPLDQLGGLVDQLTDGLETALDTILGEAGVVNVDVLVGEETLQVDAAGDGTSVAASAAAAIINVDVLEAAAGAVGSPVVDARVAVAPLQASATVPAGGIDCGAAGNPLGDLHKDASQADVRPGGQFDYTLTVPNRGPCALTDVVVTEQVDGPFTAISADPAPTSANGGRLTWNVGDLAVNETRTFTVTVTVDPKARVGATFSDTLTASGKCDGQDVTHTVNLPLPRVTDGFSGACDLSVSNTRASHLEVTPGQTFNYFVHVFNRGAEPCAPVNVVDTLDDRLEFVACTDGCANEGQRVEWNIERIDGGSGVTLTVTVRVEDDATGTLENKATISSPADKGGPHTVAWKGPQITDRSVLAPSDPPGLDRAVKTSDVGGRLPKTGGDQSLALVLALAVLGLTGVAARRFRTA